MMLPSACPVHTHRSAVALEMQVTALPCTPQAADTDRCRLLRCRSDAGQAQKTWDAGQMQVTALPCTQKAADTGTISSHRHLHVACFSSPNLCQLHFSKNTLTVSWYCQDSVLCSIPNAITVSTHAGQVRVRCRPLKVQVTQNAGQRLVRCRSRKMQVRCRSEALSSGAGTTLANIQRWSGTQPVGKFAIRQTYQTGLSPRYGRGCSLDMGGGGEVVVTFTARRYSPHVCNAYVLRRTLSTGSLSLRDTWQPGKNSV
jgi:hypothetical protein